MPSEELKKALASLDTVKNSEKAFDAFFSGLNDGKHEQKGSYDHTTEEGHSSDNDFSFDFTLDKKQRRLTFELCSDEKVFLPSVCSVNDSETKVVFSIEENIGKLCIDGFFDNPQFKEEIQFRIKLNKN